MVSGENMEQSFFLWREKMLAEQFYAWELRGRGWTVWPYAVSLEPPFRPFFGHFLPERSIVDDGRRPTFLSSLIEKLRRKLSPEPEEEKIESSEEIEFSPEPMMCGSQVELQASLAPSLRIPRELFEEFLSNVAFCSQPIAFELIGNRS